MLSQEPLRRFLGNIGASKGEDIRLHGRPCSDEHFNAPVGEHQTKKDGLWYFGWISAMKLVWNHPKHKDTFRKVYMQFTNMFIWWVCMRYYVFIWLQTLCCRIIRASDSFCSKSTTKLSQKRQSRTCAYVDHFWPWEYLAERWMELSTRAGDDTFLKSVSLGSVIPVDMSTCHRAVFENGGSGYGGGVLWVELWALAGAIVCKFTI